MGKDFLDLSPSRKQFLELKKDYLEEILLVRVGDFYEAFDEDAKLISKILGIVLTSRNVGKGLRAPLAGIPYHSIDSYLKDLVDSGYRIAICEQTEEPTSYKGIFKREVVRIITPGTIFEPDLLQNDKNNYLCSAISSDFEVGISIVDISTGECFAGDFPEHLVVDEINRHSVSELIGDNKVRMLFEESGDLPTNFRMISPENQDIFTSSEKIKNFLEVKNLKNMGCVEGKPSLFAVSEIINYISETQKQVLPKFNNVSELSRDGFLLFDNQVSRDLELFETLTPESKSLTLFGVLNSTKTSMGARLLRNWISKPLDHLKKIQDRQNLIKIFFNNNSARKEIRSILSSIPDMERLMHRIITNRINPKEIVALAFAVKLIPEIRKIIDSIDEKSPQIKNLSNQIIDLDEFSEKILCVIEEEPVGLVGGGKIIKKGFNKKLDIQRGYIFESREKLTGIEKNIKEKTGINNLKIGFNKIFGYYFEVSKSYIDQVPKYFHRKQTLVNAERYTTSELKNLESKIINARDKVSSMESELFNKLCVSLSEYQNDVVKVARIISQIDVLSNLAEISVENNYTCPTFTTENRINIKAGRHPVIEKSMPYGKFIPNDIDLSNDKRQILIITGPNMSGKSTYIRQVAMLTLMAQIGCFIPAEKAKIGLVDQLFTRAGLSDDIGAGRSTFMVEMVETATVLRRATSRSLVILDEVGRGTSTYDGLAIAKAVVEYIHNNPQKSCKTLFATHYHELTNCEEYLDRCVNSRVDVDETGKDVTFLHKIVPGASKRSYGIHVGKLAGLPKEVIDRAYDLLSDYEGNNQEKVTYNNFNGFQIPMIDQQEENWISEEIFSIDVNKITPLEALNKLSEIKRKSEEIKEDEKNI
tara:strand:- start:2330 stop:4948 length:2619 start_codon:yes stop_codon:yes gene_type:complete